MKTPSIILRAIGSAVPETRLTPEQIELWTGSPADFQRDKLGITSRRVLGPDETGVSLAAKACEDLFAHTDLQPADVELLVYVTQTPDHGLPVNAPLLQDALQLPHACASFDLGMGCSGFVYGLSAVKGFMLAEGMHNALLVTCDPLSKIVGRADRDTMAVFGDAATAAWLSTEGRGARMGRSIFGTDGAGGRHIIVPRPRSTHTGIFQPENEPDPAEYRMQMNGRAVFNFMMERIPPTLDACLEKNNLTRDEVDLFVFHQASRFMLQTLTRQLGLPPEKVPVEMEEVGNTISSSIPLILKQHQPNLDGKTVLVCGFGSGLSWAANILQYPTGEQQ